MEAQVERSDIGRLLPLMLSSEHVKARRRFTAQATVHGCPVVAQSRRTI